MHVERAYVYFIVNVLDLPFASGTVNGELKFIQNQSVRSQKRVIGNPPWRYVCITDVFIRVALNLTVRALYLQHFISIEYKSHIELFRNGLVQEFYRWKCWFFWNNLSRQWSKKKINEQNFEVYWKIRIEDRGSRDRGSVKKNLQKNK